MALNKLLLNCDLGESFGALQLDDKAIMPYIDMANIACGFHAGGPSQMQITLRLAKEQGVRIGAHPSYPDLANFGRRSLVLDHDELVALLLYQISALDGMAKSQGMAVDYVKPHGALYHDMMNNEKVRLAIFSALSLYSAHLSLVVLAGSDTVNIQKVAADYHVPLIFEAFADRQYQDDGQLVSRGEVNALLTITEIESRIGKLLVDGEILSVNGKSLQFPVDTLCVHGDTPNAVNILKRIRKILARHGL